MEFCFLLSDMPVAYGHQILRSSSGSANHVIVFVKEFERVADFQSRYPAVIWLVADIDKSLETLLKFLHVLPTPNYIVNFKGYEFAHYTLTVFTNWGISFREKERGHSELTMEELIGDDDNEETRIFFNVVERRSEMKKKTKLLRKKVLKVVRGKSSKNKTTNSSQESNDEEEDENVPLINGPETEEHASLPGFLANLFSLCCPCFKKAAVEEPEYIFQSPEDLRRQMHSEQLKEIQTTLAKLHKTFSDSWNVTMVELERRKTQKMDELSAKVEESRQQEEQKLTNIKEQQNANTRNRLSNVLNEDQLRRIEKSRARQTKGTAKYDADNAFREGCSLIAKQVAIDHTQAYERHYHKLVDEQVQKLKDIKLRYQKKTMELQQRYFGGQA